MFLFHVLNPDEVSHGQKPKLEQVLIQCMSFWVDFEIAIIYVYINIQQTLTKGWSICVPRAA